MMGDATDQFPQRLALLIRGRDVQKYQLVSPLLRIQCAQLYRIAGIPDILEIDTLYRAAILNIQTGYNAFGQHNSLISFNVINPS